MIIVVVVGVQHAEWMRRTCSIGPRKGTWSATSCIGLRAATSSAVLIVLMILGPLPGMIVKSTPIAGRGVKISAQSQSVISEGIKNRCEWCSNSLFSWQTWPLHESMRQLFHGPFWKIGKMNAERSFLYPAICLPENIMTPSTPNFLHGCRDNSMAISGVSERCLKGYFSEYFRKSAMYLPAYTIIAFNMVSFHHCTI